MQSTVRALMVHSEEQPLSSLTYALRPHLGDMIRAHTCHETRSILTKADPPRLIFTDLKLPDGTWSDVLQLASKASPALVIVVSPDVDAHLYLDALEQGAFDFLVPPFVGAEVAHVLRCALHDLGAAA
jgi:DNA-binding NtrC family response regulator